MIEININEKEPSGTISRIIIGNKVKCYFKDDDFIKKTKQENVRFNDKLISNKKKLVKKQNVNDLKVTTKNKNTFNANEKSQNAMMRNILTMANGDEVLWGLANNVDVLITKAELMEALSLAVKKQTALRKLTQI